MYAVFVRQAFLRFFFFLPPFFFLFSFFFFLLLFRLRRSRRFMVMGEMK